MIEDNRMFVHKIDDIVETFNKNAPKKTILRLKLFYLNLEGTLFRFVTVNETWLHHDNTEPK